MARRFREVREISEADEIRRQEDLARREREAERQRIREQERRLREMQAREVERKRWESLSPEEQQLETLKREVRTDEYKKKDLEKEFFQNKNELVKSTKDLLEANNRYRTPILEQEWEKMEYKRKRTNPTNEEKQYAELQNRRSYYAKDYNQVVRNMNYIGDEMTKSAHIIQRYKLDALSMFANRQEIEDKINAEKMKHGEFAKDYHACEEKLKPFAEELKKIDDKLRPLEKEIEAQIKQRKEEYIKSHLIDINKLSDLELSKPEFVKQLEFPEESKWDLASRERLSEKLEKTRSEYLTLTHGLATKKATIQELEEIVATQHKDNEKQLDLPSDYDDCAKKDLEKNEVDHGDLDLDNFDDCRKEEKKPAPKNREEILRSSASLGKKPVPNNRSEAVREEQMKRPAPKNRDEVIRDDKRPAPPMNRNDLSQTVSQKPAYGQSYQQKLNDKLEQDLIKVKDMFSDGTDAGKIKVAFGYAMVLEDFKNNYSLEMLDSNMRQFYHDVEPMLYQYGAHENVLLNEQNKARANYGAELIGSEEWYDWRKTQITNTIDLQGLENWYNSKVELGHLKPMQEKTHDRDEGRTQE